LQIAFAVLSTIDLRRAPHALIHRMGDSPHKTKSPAEMILREIEGVLILLAIAESPS